MKALPVTRCQLLWVRCPIGCSTTDSPPVLTNSSTGSSGKRCWKGWASLKPTREPTAGDELLQGKVAMSHLTLIGRWVRPRFLRRSGEVRPLAAFVAGLPSYLLLFYVGFLQSRIRVKKGGFFKTHNQRLCQLHRQSLETSALEW